MGMFNYVFVITLLLMSLLIIGILWRYIRDFFHNNYSFFDVSFIIVYFVEQFILILLLEYIPNKIVLWVSLFALIVVTTSALQKLTMDSRDKELRKLYAISEHLFKDIRNYNLNLIKENEELKNMQQKLTNYMSRKLKK